MSDNETPVPLSKETTEAVNNYLWRLAALFGLGNLVVIGSALGFVFFILPQQATEMALGALQHKNQELSTHMQGVIADILMKAGNAQSDLQNAQTTIGGVGEKLPELTVKLKHAEDALSEVERLVVSLRDRPATELQNLVDSIERYPDLKTVTERLPTLEQAIAKAVIRRDDTGFVGIGTDRPKSLVDIAGDLTVRNNIWSGKAETKGYGNGAHVWTVKKTQCPNGKFVTGINVHYRGSCQEQCNPDGGIVGEIELVCNPL